MIESNANAADFPLPDPGNPEAAAGGRPAPHAVVAPAEASPVTREWFESLPRCPHFLNNPLRALAWLARGLAGTVFGIALLSGMASVPGLNVLALGYLLEITGRVARTGRFRSVFYLAPLTARLAGIVTLAVLLLLPVRFLAGLARDAALLAPGSAAAWGWTATATGAGLLAVGHILLVIARGGCWWWFFRPMNNCRWIRTAIREGRFWKRADGALRELAAALRPWHHLRLGFFGYAGVYAWLVLPTLVFGLAPEVTGRLQTVCLLAGSAALVIVLGWLPFMQAHFAKDGRWRAFLELGAVRKRFRRSPFCWTLSATLLFGLSAVVLLYVALIKNDLPPHVARWDVMVVFLSTVLPAKVLVAWAWHRSGHREEAWRVWQWFNRLLLGFALGWYVYFLFLARTGGQLGRDAMWQHHALLLPFPF